MWRMKKLLLILSMSIFYNSFLSAQDFGNVEQDFAADSIYLKCLYETKHFISTNTLQFIVGTANINYEYMLTKQASIKIGAGTIMGYRILVEEHIIVDKGSRYILLEPRYYTPNAASNCWMNIAIGFSYKYWDYTQKEPTDDKDPITNKTIYTTSPIKSHMFGTSLIGKHPVTAGFTFEYQIGIDMGILQNKTYISPNIGFSMGMIF